MRPAALAISHTYRLAWDCGDEAGKKLLIDSLATFSNGLDPVAFFQGTQHIDPDSLIFDFEKAVCKLV